jgi:protein-tyrosine-phosphatase
MTLDLDNSIPKPLNVLFLCTHNSARSILAEGLATKLGNGRLIGHSAGSRPGGVVNPHALETLRERNCKIENLRSKSWDEYARPGAAPLDLVITVCDNAARESCPIWPGAPVTANWACRDPSAAAGGDQATSLAFRRTADLIARRLERLLKAPLDGLPPAVLAEQVNAIARDVPEG